MSAQEKRSWVPSFVLGAVFCLGVGLVILVAKCPPVPAPAGQPAPAPSKPVAEPVMYTPVASPAPAPAPAKAEEPAK